VIKRSFSLKITNTYLIRLRINAAIAARDSDGRFAGSTKTRATSRLREGGCAVTTDRARLAALAG